jgi:hypothetical protein
MSMGKRVDIEKGRFRLLSTAGSEAIKLRVITADLELFSQAN